MRLVKPFFLRLETNASFTIFMIQFLYLEAIRGVPMQDLKISIKRARSQCSSGVPECSSISVN